MLPMCIIVQGGNKALKRDCCRRIGYQMECGRPIYGELHMKMRVRMRMRKDTDAC